ncbi:uncharacterized protein PAC_06648 [Phialocephala subalpina]|uniref:Fatty acid hydroxylase domain-containing protein n=1 Tax=Phialocephala subalpina TaxID=576137 RepID=A0A1L7WVH1_9HELO|nr:uncharacterized protein PAC_06648 [Phialocephala subalpina]
MNSTRVLLFLHVLLAATLFGIFLGGTGTFYTSDDLSPLKSAITSKDGVSNSHIEIYERFARDDHGNESQKALGQSLPSHPSMADAHAPLLAQLAMNRSQSTLEDLSVFSNSTPNLPQLATAMSLLIPRTEQQAWISNICRVHIGYLLSYFLRAITSASPIVIVVSSMWLYFSGSFFFDVGHYTLHKFSKSQSRILRNIGYLHEVHHFYFNRQLKFNERYRWQNMCFELPLELFCQLFGTWLGYLLASFASLTGPGLLSKEILVLALTFEVIRSTVVACMEGRDSNHKSYSPVVPKDPHTFLVGPEYHALHHVDPSSYIGSSFKVFDWMLGTSASLRSRRVTIFGNLGTFGVALKKELLSESVSCVEELELDSERSEESRLMTMEVLKRTDILILGSDLGRGQEMDKLVELFKTHQKAKPTHSLLLPEVWSIDTGANACPTLGHQSHGTSVERRPALERYHKRYHDDEDILYRHIVCHSRIEWFNTRPEWAAKTVMWWIRRGARSVPATFDLSAFF